MKHVIAFRLLGRLEVLKQFEVFGAVTKSFPGALGDMGHRYVLEVLSPAHLGAAFASLKGCKDIQYVEMVKENKEPAADDDPGLEGAMA